ncbi:putative ABC transport system substrate-binding protein [Amphibacillus marinus]|uniref:Putative ABC transport system substrate-binding protein n=1 Tax=Amphibacillus marinus TaxID=872970 RepID=A0A1H8K0Y7_9BACI|nr:ABC transporter substrate-binding protein [Amphibacillus marinus]SEN86461.1 putative ABC transport system substrate-binding protein [Amphibacillus marinus]
MNKKWLIGLLCSITLLLLFACGTSDNDNVENQTDPEAEQGDETEANGGETTVYRIGASQFVEHPSLDAAYEGFKAAIADAGLEVEYDLQSAQADQSNTATIAQNFVADNVDLIFANATPSAQSALQATSDIPIVFTSVTDAIGAGLVEAMDQPGENITGVMDMHPDAIIETVNFIDTYFSGSAVGLIYNAGEQNSVAQVDSVTAAIEGTSLSTIERTISTSAEVQQAATSLVGEADVIYIVTDNTVVSALESVVGVANDQDIPLIVGEPDSLERGGFATFGIDYYTIGYRAGEMAVEILTGERVPSEIDVEYPPEMQLYLNEAAAEEQGIEWNSDWDELAELQ